jgi:hypothetical protein
MRHDNPSTKDDTSAGSDQAGRAAAPQVGDVPRSYRITTEVRWLCLLGIGAGVAALVGVAYRGQVYPHRPGLWFLATLAVMFTVGTSAAAVLAARCRVILRGDLIELIELGAPKRRRRSELAGVRRRRTSGAPIIELVAREPGARSLKISGMYGRDQAFHEWLRELPDLDAADTQRALDAFLASAAHGETREAHLARLVRGRRFAGVMVLVGLAVAAWAAFFPRPYLAAVFSTALLPLFLIALPLAGGMFRMVEGQNEVLPSVGPALLAPTGALGLRALMDFELLGLQTAALYSLGGGLGMLAIVLLADSDLRRRPLVSLGFLLLFAFYFLGAMVEVNCVGDGSPAQVFSANVLGRSRPRQGEATSRLELGPWGPRKEPTSMRVPGSVADGVSVGQAVSVTVRAGRLGLPWCVVSASDVPPGRRSGPVPSDVCPR